MTADEWDKIVALITANWPHSMPPEEALAKWGNDLADCVVDEVYAAVEALYRDGREHAPNGGQIRAKIVELRMSQVPGPEDAYALAMHAASSVGFERGLDWLRERQPVVALAAERFPWRSLCLEPIDDGVRRGQFTKIFNAVLASVTQGERYEGLPGRSEGAPRRLSARPLGEIIREHKKALTAPKEAA